MGLQTFWTTADSLGNNLYFKINILFNSVQQQKYTSDFSSDAWVCAELYLLLFYNSLNQTGEVTVANCIKTDSALGWNKWQNMLLNKLGTCTELCPETTSESDAEVSK
jgi:hypothetical protein